ncbi:MAG: protoheme IX farnesyltransferase [Candidatus Poriferisodalaceae bacterium]|jgi:heme o synthase
MAQTSVPAEASMAGLTPTRRAAAKAGAFVMLTKPRIIELLLVTTVPTMVVAENGMPGLWLIVLTVLGGTLAAGGANTFNMYVDRDIDALMVRTQGRPLVTGAVQPRSALIFGFVLELSAFALLWWGVNLLSAVLAVSACLFYVFVYTLWLKRTSKQNIVIGGAAGAVPALVGWAAVTDSLPLAPWLLFGVIFFWTPPHFWALAIKYTEDYQAAGVPMLPAVASIRTTALQMIWYTVVVIALSLWFHVAAGTGAVYLLVALSSGIFFLVHTIKLLKDPDAGRAMRVFGYSITYLGALFLAMAVDVLVREGF